MTCLPSNSSRNPASDDVQALLPEPMFLRTLCLERKRAERSRQPFVLMLLDRVTSGPAGAVDTLATIVPAVLSSIREIDTPGWYKENTVLGVLFIELGSTDTQSILGTLRTRITTTLQGFLSPAELARIRITLHHFPEDRKDAETALPTHELYPDLAQRDQARKLPHTIKRTIDLLGSSMTLLLLSPLFLLIGLAIKLTSPGPILFRQKRIGRYGIPFTCLKFRSMHVDNDPRIHIDYVKQFISGNVAPDASRANGNVYKITKDPRLTRVGRFLRKASLDELPQIINVVRGEMSLVGPRPPIPYELEAYDIWHRRRLFEVKPGITGLWQVNGRSRLPFDEMVRLDLQYATRWSLWLDFKILLRTPRAVFSGEGAY
jgi:lipopolysaccharide/colanic/teichoic acid biosynthesis glycosyltransferase